MYPREGMLPYAGMDRIRFIGTLSTAVSGRYPRIYFLSINSIWYRRFQFFPVR